jgi:hypothetical protein
MISHSITILHSATGPTPPARRWWVTIHHIITLQYETWRMSTKIYTKKQTAKERCKVRFQKRTSRKNLPPPAMKGAKRNPQDVSRRPAGLPDSYLPIRLRGFLVLV